MTKTNQNYDNNDDNNDDSINNTNLILLLVDEARLLEQVLLDAAAWDQPSSIVLELSVLPKATAHMQHMGL